jgi:hypothetical protein
MGRARFNNKNKNKQNKTNSSLQKLTTMVAKMAVNQGPKLITKLVKGSKKRKNGKKQMPKMDPYMTMIADPCNASLVPGMYGSNQGMLARFKASYSFAEFNALFASYKYGYVIWYPTYHCPATTTGSANLFFYGASTASAAPTLLNYGVFGATGTAVAGTDPAYNFTNSDTCQDARTLSACITSSYLGTTSAAQGLYVPLTNIPLELPIFGGTGGAPPSVDQLRNYATFQERAATSDEVVWRPSVSSTFFPPARGGLTTSSGSSTTMGEANIVSNPMGIAILFYGVSALSDYTVTCYKNVEWRAEPSSGLTFQPPVGVDSPVKITNALNKLDKSKPFWQTKTFRNAAIAISETALAGLPFLL